MGIDRQISELVDILKMEIRSFNSINELLILEEKALISCDSAAIADLTGRLGDVLSSVACLEKSRLEVLERIAAETGREARELNVSMMAKLASADIRKDLVESGKILSAIYEDIKRRKSANTLLIRQGIVMVENDIRLMLNTRAQIGDKSALYSSGQAPLPSPGGVYFDGTM
jgi:flagellar biosynthesis/type III secretory pathway chaperone